MNRSPSSSTSEVATSAGDLEAITVAYHPVPFVSALVLGVAQGLFADQGLHVTLKERSAGATPFAVASNSCDIGYASVPAVLSGRATGLQLKVIANAGGWARDPAAATLQVVVPRDSTIVEPKDLEWRKLAVQAFGQLPHVSVIISARKLGVDPGKFRFVDTPFDQMSARLAAGEIDAADIGEPYLTEALEGGARVVFSNAQGFAPEASHSIWITSDNFAADNPETVQRFRRGIEAANDRCAANPQEARQIMTTFTSTTPALASRIRMPHFSNRLDRATFKDYMETMRSLGLIWTELDLKDVFLS